MSDQQSGERLQKVLARAGYGSRRVCDDLVGNGRVTVNGELAQPGRRVDPAIDKIAVDGVQVSVREGLVYYLLNKPAGYVSTASDPEGRRTVVELVPSEPRVFSVGRLDYETEGLLVLTNDGDLTQLLTHPKFGVAKTYLAEVEGVPTPGELRTLRTGVDLDDGPTAPASVALVQEREPGAAIELTIHEGRNRQIRRMCAAVGHPVRRLVRTRIGPLSDRKLRPGEWRPLSVAEVRALYEAASSEAADNTPGSAPAPG